MSDKYEEMSDRSNSDDQDHSFDNQIEMGETTERSIKEVLDPFFVGINEQDLRSIICLFVGHNPKKNFFGNDRSKRCYVLPYGKTLDVVSGDRSGNEMTFNKVCAYVAELNRSLSEDKRIVPHLYNEIFFDESVSAPPLLFRYYFHYGIQFNFAESDEHIKRNILIAINCIDMCLENYSNNRLKERKDFRTVQGFLDSNSHRRIYKDLSKTVGHQSVKEIEDKFQTFLFKIYPNIHFVRNYN